MTDLVERYGAPSRARRPIVITLAVVLGVAGLAWLAWAALAHGRPQVTSQLDGFEIHGQHAVRATFTVVRRDPEVKASCLLRASADDHAVVGERLVRVASGDTERRLAATMRTERRATTVDLVGCTAPGQSTRR